ncbi:MAG: sugar-binding domain-containing protein [Paludibacter sp.]
MNNIVKKISFVASFLAAFLCNSYGNTPFTENFDNTSVVLKTIGRGNCRLENGVFKSKDAYSCFGDKNLKDYRFSFSARAPKDAEQVQIWAGFRAFNRFDRYVVGLQGGLLNELYLSRMGYMGADELLSLAMLDFHPETGKWYDLKVEVCGNRIRIFLNDETLPRIDVIDKNTNLAPAGYVTLGGGWIDTEFDNLKIEPLTADALSEAPQNTYKVEITAQEKERKRQQERAAYQPKKIASLNPSRTEISLDGNWLFMPDYQLNDKTSQVNTNTNDENWHVMNVPDFWNPIRIWLHGETMNNNKFPKGVSDTYYQKETARCENYTFDFRRTKAAWYRQWVELPSGIENKTSELVFDAVSKMADVYVNGNLVTNHVGMFGEIRIDISKYLKAGKNLIAVYVTKDYANNDKKDSSQPDFYSIARTGEASSSRKVGDAVSVPVTKDLLKNIAHGFYQEDPAGIWQPVSLVISNPVRVEDVFIRPTLVGATFDVTLKNNSDKNVKINLSTDIIDNETNNLFYTENSLKNIEIPAGKEKTVTYAVKNLKPRLWTPQHPNLYDFKFKLVDKKNQEEDVLTVRSGFRTFESKNGLFYLNNVPYWLRGGNHTPFALAPNDTTLANTFYQLMKAANMEITRTHTTPYNQLWIDAADENGIGISHEGTWPWLMIHSTMPEMSLIEMWADEYMTLLKKYRNHPSILFWTINNEMKFYDLEPDMERRKMKMKIISDVVKRMREIDPTRPICFDSNYRRNENMFGKDFFKDIDDGDIDDVHAYFNWYDHTIFKQFSGEFQRDHKNEGRPLIGQEMSTGYPNNETGHATRFYTLVHQNPQTLVGYQAYAFGNPEAFLKTQAFITGELAEAFRRSNDKASGFLHFALLTWFRNVYDARNIEPYPTYYVIQRALQPVLVSAELWGRHFYAGEKLPARFCVVNDLEDGQKLKSGLLYWSIESENGQILTKGNIEIPEVEQYKRFWVTPEINIPENLPADKTKAKLKLRLTEEGKQVSVNEYEVLLAQKSWVQIKNEKNIVLLAGNDVAKSLNFIGVKYTKAANVTDALKLKADLLILSGLDKNLSATDIANIRNFIARGGKALILNSEETSKALFPEYITAWITPTEGDIVNMEIPESAVFDGIDLLELRYFNNNQREIPTVCHSAFKINRNVNVEELANQTKIHGYIEGEMDVRSAYVKTIKGFPILKITEGKGTALISSMAHEKTVTDPVAGRLLTNMINEI